MAKIVASLAALFLYGSLGVASAGGSIHHGSADGSALAKCLQDAEK